MSESAPRPTPQTARDQVARLLSLVPLVNARGQVSVSEAAGTLGIPSAVLRKDLDRLFMCGLPGGLPDDLIDIDYEALEEHDLIRVSNADYLARPLRLTATEATALIVALRALRSASTSEGSRDVVDRALAKLERAAAGAGSAGSVDPGDLAEPDGADPVLAALRTAIERRRRVRIDYYVPSRDELGEREIDPHDIFRDHGQDYVDAWCHSAQAPRSFRVDRIRDVVELDQSWAEQGTQDREPDGLSPRLFSRGPNLREVRLRLRPEASWAVEYYPVEEVHPLPDGDLEVLLLVSDQEWLQRLLFRLAPDACVLSPPDIAEEFQRRVSATLGLYADTA
jgi:proteasome accessory factor C